MLMGWRFDASLPKVGRGLGSAALVPPLPAAAPPLASSIRALGFAGFRSTAADGVF
jgi:hypothetical protein